MAAERKFLDYLGLQHFWMQIKDYTKSKMGIPDSVQEALDGKVDSSDIQTATQEDLEELFEED